MAKAKNGYCVIYRTGGRERCTWIRILPYQTWEEADKVRKETERMGYKALVEDYDKSLKIGLPEGWGTD